MKNFVTLPLSKLSIQGIRHPPHSWKFWNLDLLENDQIKSLQDDRAHQLKCEFKIILISLYVRFGLKMHFERSISMKMLKRSVEMNKVSSEKN